MPFIVVLGIAVILWPFWDCVRLESKRETKKLRQAGCICDLKFWGIRLVPGCPVHGHPVLLDRHEPGSIPIFAVIPAMCKTILYCEDCVSRVKKRGYQFVQQKEFGECVGCGHVREVIRVPEKALRFWYGEAKST